jgi:RimJ/RimL family protein N-acetyltransferase
MAPQAVRGSIRLAAQCHPVPVSSDVRAHEHTNDMQPVFLTRRLVARRITASDISSMLAVYGDPEVVRYVADGKPLDRARCEQWIEVTLRNYVTRGYGMVALAERTNGSVIGFCGLVHPAGQVEPEIKYALRRDCWGQGFATEAAIGLLGYARQLALPRVIATTDPENESSHRVLLKAGMGRGELRRNDDGSFTQLFHWSPELGADGAP